MLLHPCSFHKDANHIEFSAFHFLLKPKRNIDGWVIIINSFTIFFERFDYFLCNLTKLLMLLNKFITCFMNNYSYGGLVNLILLC